MDSEKGDLSEKHLELVKADHWEEQRECLRGSL